MKIDFDEIFRILDAKANSIFVDSDRITELTNKVKKMVSENQILMEIWDDLKTFFDLFKDYFSGEYTDVEKNTIITIIIGFIYLISPIDLIPDFFPGGLLDDLAVFLYIFKTLEGEINQYRAWKTEKDKYEEIFEITDSDIVDK